MKLETAELDEWMRASFPVRSGNAELSFVSSFLRDDAFWLVLRVVVWEEDRIRDIKEQEVRFCSTLDAEPKERVRALIQGWEAVLEEVLRDLGDGIDYLMPHDLVPVGAIRLARSHTREDFERALRAKGRLGKHLKS